MPEELEFSTKAMPGQLSVDEAEGIVEAFVAGIGNKDSVGDIVLPGAFAASLKRRKPRVVWGHNWNEPIGKVLDIYEVGPDDPRLPAKMKAARIGGLFARVQFNLKSERGREAFANIAFFGMEQEWSIGYKTITAAYDNTRQANLLREVELYEVSPVLHGANQLTGTISVKSDKMEDRVTSFKKSKWPMFDRSFAEMVKEEHSKIWDAGGNIKGDDQYTILTRIAEQGGVAQTEDQVRALELREAWVARHEGDFLLPGVIAQIKWLAIGSRGEGHMKDVVRGAIKKAETKGDGYGGSGREGSSDDDPMEELQRIAARMRTRDETEDEEENEDEGQSNDAMGRRAVLARALANELRTPVRIRTITGNTVVFDVMDESEQPTTMRASWHAEGGRVMIGRPERVRVETVYIPETGEGGGEAYMGDEEFKAPIPPDAIPQERITGDVLRGYGPRRGNLERLLRYWRPIMRKPGGFRRCLVILADHPELYPLANICAWLHHETTGLWPNEGCHHPGMKNCRRKLRGVVRGSLLSDSEFDNRLRRMGGQKGMPDPFEDDYEKGSMGEVTEEDIEYANKVMNWFVGQEKEFMGYLADEKNWMHEGDDEDGDSYEHEWVKPTNAPAMISGKRPGDCGCGCSGAGGKGSCMDDEKSLKDELLDLEEKVGRALNSRNSDKISQAIRLLSEVVGEEAAGVAMQRKGDSLVIEAPMEDLFELREMIDPIIEHYALEAEIDEKGIHLTGLMTDGVEVAFKTALSNFEDIQTKSAGQSGLSESIADRFLTALWAEENLKEKGIGNRIGSGGSFIPRDGDGDGFFSPGPKMPDKTPVSKLPEAMAKISDDDLLKVVGKKPQKPIGGGRIGFNAAAAGKQDKDQIAAYVELRKRGKSKDELAKIAPANVAMAGEFKFDGERQTRLVQQFRDAPNDRPKKPQAGAAAKPLDEKYTQRIPYPKSQNDMNKYADEVEKRIRAIKQTKASRSEKDSAIANLLDEYNDVIGDSRTDSDSQDYLERRLENFPSHEYEDGEVFNPSPDGPSGPGKNSAGAPPDSPDDFEDRLKQEKNTEDKLYILEEIRDILNDKDKPVDADTREKLMDLRDQELVDQNWDNAEPSDLIFFRDLWDQAVEDRKRDKQTAKAKILESLLRRFEKDVEQNDMEGFSRADVDDWNQTGFVKR
jgi:HK97 family phage prohead protease